MLRYGQMATKTRTKVTPPSPYAGYFKFKRLAAGATLADPFLFHTGIVEREIPSNVLRIFRTSTDLTIDEIAMVVGISPRTIGRKEKSAAPLTTAQADRAMRLARVTHAAVDAIGDLQRAVRWLRKPHRALHGQAPLRLIASELGTELVFAALDRIAYGGVV